MHSSAGRSTGHMSWEQAHRLELTLRTRAARFGGRAGRCPGCGKPVADGADQIRLAGTVVHTGCLREDALT